MDVVLLHPPVALPCEPPIGLGLLAAGLRARGVAVELCDLSVEALEALLASVPEETARSMITLVDATFLAAAPWPSSAESRRDDGAAPVPPPLPDEAARGAVVAAALRLSGLG